MTSRNLSGRFRAIAFMVLLVVVSSALVRVATTHAQLANSAWPMFHHDLRHTGLSPVDTSGNNGTPKWSLAEGGSPVIGTDGTLYSACLVTENSVTYSLCALNPDGSQKWVFGPTEEADINGTSPAIGADGTIYYGLTEPDEGDFSMFYAVNPDGSQKWAVPGAGGTAPTVGPDGTIYVHAGFSLDAYSPSDGSLKWSAEVFGVSSPAIGADGTIYVGSDGIGGGFGGALYALNPVDGSEKWLFPTSNGTTVLSTIVYSSPAIGADGTVYIGDEESDFPSGNPAPSHLYAVNPSVTTTCGTAPNTYTCPAEKWEFAANGSFADSSPAIGADSTIYIGDEEQDPETSEFVPSHLYAVNPDGTQKWAFSTSGIVGSSAAIGADGTIYIADSRQFFNTSDPSSHLYAVNSDGTLKWSMTTVNGADPGASGSPVIGPDGTVYVGSVLLYAVGGPPTTISVPGSLPFGNDPVGDPVTKNLTVKNSGSKPLLMGSITSSNPEFAATGATTCPSAGLSPGLTCTITIRFTPSALGSRSATLSVNDNTPTSPQHVALSGNGTIDTSVMPTSYGFGSVKDGSKEVKAIVVHNFQTNSVSLGESFSGPNSGDFSVTGGTCTSTLAKTSACSLIVTFAPTATGTESATMMVTDGPDPLGPYTVTFTALATLPESLSPTKLVFGNVAETASKTLNLTISNKATSGSITLTGTNIGGANASDFAVTGGTCGGSLAASSSCTYAVTFTPSTESAEAGTVSVEVLEDPNGGPPAVHLTGTGLASLRVSPASSAFGTVANGHSSTARTITLANLGAAAISLSHSVSGTNASDFAVTGGTCGVSLAGGTSCTYLLKFTPSIDGAEGAMLAVSGSGDSSSPHNVGLSGTGNGIVATTPTATATDTPTPTATDTPTPTATATPTPIADSITILTATCTLNGSEYNIAITGTAQSSASGAYIAAYSDNNDGALPGQQSFCDGWTGLFIDADESFCQRQSGDPYVTSWSSSNTLQVASQQANPVMDAYALIVSSNVPTGLTTTVPLICPGQYP